MLLGLVVGAQVGSRSQAHGVRGLGLQLRRVHPRSAQLSFELGGPCGGLVVMSMRGSCAQWLRK